MRRVFLFDIDFTMIRTNGAGAAAMTETLHDVLGIANGFAGVHFGGRTDRSLLREALTAHGRLDEDFEAFVERFKDRYFPSLDAHLRRLGGDVLPGVPALLDALAGIEDARLGLVTGNFRGAAEIKLRYFDLWHRFPNGGFADDGEDRADVVAAALDRVGAGQEAVYVFGDSVHDIVAAKAHGAVAVGVVTGSETAAALCAAGADVVVPNLADADAVLKALAMAR
ncbi:MAG: HAD-IA family hydrolase [Dehalococcoidia bacterium]